MRIGNRNIKGSPWDAPKPRRYTQTDIEVKLAQILGTFGTQGEFWVPQFRIPNIEPVYRRHPFDFGVPSLKAVIEADGCRWHGCRQCYPNAEPRQRDQMINWAVEAAGWRIMRIWGHAIKGSPADVRRLLAKFLETP